MSKTKKSAPKSVKKPIAKVSSQKAAPKTKPTPKPVAKKAPALARKPVAPVKKTAAPVKKTVAPKAPAKPVAKPPAKPLPKVSAKPVAVAKPAPKPVAKAPVKSAPPPKSSGKGKSSAKPAPKKPVMDHAVAVKTLTDHRMTNGQESPVAKRAPRVAPVAFSLADIDEYLKVRRNIRINEYIPGQEEKPKSGKAGAKNQAKIADAPVRSRVVTTVSVADLLGFNPFVKKGDIDPSEEAIPQKHRKYYKLLLELRDHVNEGLATHTEEALKKTGKDDTGDVSAYSQHMADAGTDSFDRDFALSLVNNEQEALYEIAEAIDRMKNGAYGVCEITQKAIPHERLVAVPFTRYSAEGQRQIERTRRGRGGRRTGGNPLIEMNEGVGFGTSGGEGEESEES